MKLRLVKCLICDHWRLKREDDHCPICNAARIKVGHSFIHINVMTGMQIVTGRPYYHRIVTEALDGRKEN